MADVLAVSPDLFLRQFATIKHEIGQQICMKEMSKQTPTTEKNTIKIVANIPMVFTVVVVENLEFDNLQ